MMNKGKWFQCICVVFLSVLLFFGCEVATSQTTTSYDYSDFVSSSIDSAFVGKGSNDEGTFSVDTEDNNLSFTCIYDGYKKLIINIYKDNDEGGINAVETSGYTTTVTIYKNWLPSPLYSVDLQATSYSYTSSTSYALTLSLTADAISYEINLAKTNDLTDSTWILSENGSDLITYENVTFQ